MWLVKNRLVYSARANGHFEITNAFISSMNKICQHKFLTKEKKSKKDATFMIICCLAWPLAEIVTRIYLVRILFGKEKKKKERKNVSQSGLSYCGAVWCKRKLACVMVPQPLRGKWAGSTQSAIRHRRLLLWSPPPACYLKSRRWISKLQIRPIFFGLFHLPIGITLAPIATQTTPY